MKLKKLLTMALAGALLIGATVSASAAELDTAWYAAKNPDVVAALGNSPEAMKLHYEMFGRKEGRMANTRDVEAQLRRLFKAEEYAARYPDIKAAFGTNAEAMFQHYISYGLLEGRRPSEKVSQAAATSLKETVEKAMADAGIAVAPGSGQLVEIITGTISADAGGAAVRQALENAAPAIEKAVADTVKEATNPTPASSGGSSSSSGSSSGSSSSGGSSSGGSSSGSSSSGGSSGSVTPAEPDTPTVTYEDASGNDPGDAIIANLEDHGTVSGNDVNTELKKISISVSTRRLEKKVDGESEGTFAEVTVGAAEIPEHTNGGKMNGYWFGIGVPYAHDGMWGYADSREEAIDLALGEYTEMGHTSEMAENSKNYYTFYWGSWSERKWGYLIVKVSDNEYQRYVVDFNNLTKGKTRADLLASIETEKE